MVYVSNGSGQTIVGDMAEIQTQLDAVSVRLSSSSKTSVLSSMADAGPSQGGEVNEMNTKADILNYLKTQGIQEMFAVETIKECPHLTMVESVPQAGLNVEAPCSDCENVGENWVCLICYKVYCSRYVNEHMVKHGKEAQHPVVMSYADLSVWCYECDGYLENEVLKPALRSAHMSKFGTDINV